MLFTKKTINTVPKVIEAIKKPQLEIIFGYFGAELNGKNNVTNERILKMAYWDLYPKMKRIVLKLNLENFKEVDLNKK